jgi:glycerol-1-phosphate dehydrogenase [NAD(P)+]
MPLFIPIICVDDKWNRNISMAFLPIKTSLLPPSLSQGETTRCLQVIDGLNISVEADINWQETFSALNWPHDTALVCDNNTWPALARDLADTLKNAGFRITLINLGSSPLPDEETVGYVCNQASRCKALIAVGSGTLNDITKYSAHQLQKPYAICGTAPSMNGYLSANAAITVKGHKQSLKAALPCAALFDTNILAAAPDRMKQAGIGDSICRPTAQADWLLSHHLMGTSYDPLPFKLLQPFEADMLKGKNEALIKTLLLSGVGMTLCGGSYPASQGEHLVAHYMDMRYPDIAHTTLHGEQIAVSTLFMSALQQGLLALREAPSWVAESLPDETYCTQHFGVEVGASVWKEWQAKRDAMGTQEEFNERLAKKWPMIREDIMPHILPLAAVDRSLRRNGAPRTAQELGWTPEQFTEAAHNAHLIRNRFTFIDLGVLAKQAATRH